MELLATNITSYRKETIDDREYLVAPLTMIVEGVLSGSKGSLFYPREEISTNFDRWNGMPVTANHPSINGTPISARSPRVYKESQVGTIFNTAVNNGVLTAEAWIDIKTANRVDKRIVQKIYSGEKINVSTGLFTNDEKAPDGAAHNGKSYTHIARNYQPDHLAILVDHQGACSVRDGCGININKDSVKTTINAEESIVRDQLVAWLVTNCECYKGKNAVLNDDKSFSEADLTKLKENAEAATLAVNTLKKIGTELSIPADTTLASLPEVVKNKVADAAKNVMTEMTDEEKKKAKDKESTTMNAETFKTNMLSAMGAMTEKEYLDSAPAAIKALITNAKQVTEEKKIDIIKALVANIKSDEAKKAKILALNKKSLEDLVELRSLIGDVVPANNKSDDDRILANYFGAAGGSNGKSTPAYNRNDVLLPNAVENGTSEEVEVVYED